MILPGQSIGAKFAPVRLDNRDAYAFSMALPAVALAILTLVPGLFVDQPPIVIFAIPIILSAYLGGLRAGLTATAASWLAVRYFIADAQYSAGTVAALPWQGLVVVVAGALISVAAETLHRTRRRGNEAIEQQQIGQRALKQSQDEHVARMERDDSVRRAHVLEIERLNRMYSARSAINQAMVQMRPREELFASVCRILVDHGGVQAAWILWDVGGAPTLSGRATTAEAAALFPVGEGGVAELGCSEPSATALREQRTVIHEDMRLIPGTPAWVESIERTGLRECAAFPIRQNHKVCGTVTVATDAKGFFQSKEIALLEEVARDVSFALDIARRETKRQEADLSLLLERDRFRRLFDYAPVGLIIADPRGRYLEVNQVMRRLVGYSRAELVGNDASLIVAAEEAAHIAPAVVAINTSPNYEREWRFRHKNGSEFAAEVRAITMPDGNLLATIRDVTERNDATEAVRVAEERMRFALESSNIGIWDMDYATGALQWSETIEAHYGLDPGTFGHTFEAFMDCVHPDDRRALLATMEKAARSGRDFTVQNRALWADGTIRHLRGAGRIMLDDRGQPSRGIGISIDVTDQRNLEDQFQQSQKMESMGRLAGGIAHDFNNLLTIILGYCELLTGDLDGRGPQREDIAEIQRAGRSAADLTRQLLAFSRKQVIAPSHLALSAEVKDVTVMLGRLLGDNVRIELDLDPRAGTITADRGQVEQLIINLAVNARDAMPEGGTLTITTRNVSLDEDQVAMHPAVQPGNYARLGVTDTGCGMTPEVQARLFEPFFTTKEVGKGTGLGLSTVHGIVARSGGTITVQSAPGRGTTFNVFFPIAEGVEPSAVTDEETTDQVVGGRTILVVDDAKSLRELTRRLAERLGYRVMLAANADEALRAVAEHPEIDLVLTDVVMPGWNGLELSRRILDHRPDVKVVLMSGYADDALSQDEVSSADIVLLHKPFTSEQLAQRLREAFET